MKIGISPELSNRFNAGAAGKSEPRKRDGVTPREEPSGPNLRVAALLDGTEKRVEPFLIKRMDDLEKLKAEAGDKMEGQAVVFRSGVSARKKALSGALKLAASIAPLALGALGGPAGVVFALAFESLLFAAHTPMDAIGELDSARHHRRETQEPDWKGERHYRIAPDRTPQIDSEELYGYPGDSRITPGNLTELFYGHFTPDHPETTNVLLVGGHGLGFRQIAGMSGEKFSERIHNQPDIILMESCLEGNLEFLSQLSNRAQYAILSEEPLSVNALPVKEMLREASTPETDAGVIAKNMLKAAKEHQGETIKTLAVYDLGKVDNTLKSLDRLGKALNGEIDRGNRSEIKAALKKARKPGASRLTPLENRLLGFADLGDFLSALQRKNLKPETLKLAKAAKKSLEEMVVAKIGDKKHQNLSGVSFLSRNTMDHLAGSGFLNVRELGTYESVPLPGNWKRFIEKL